MGRKSKLLPHFQGVNYSSVHEVLTHTEELRVKILFSAKKPTRRAASLSPLEHSVLPLAVRLQNRRRALWLISEHLAKKRVFPGLSLQQIHAKVDNVVGQLRRKGLLEPPRSVILPRLRRVSSKAVEKNMGLVHMVINKGHPYILPSWWRYMSRDEAVSHGRYGLMRALETYKPSAGAKSTHLILRIAGEIGRAVHQRMAEDELHISIDEERQGEGTSLHNVLSRPPFDPAEIIDHSFEKNLNALIRKSTQPHLIAIYTLSGLYGFTASELGRYFRVSPQAITQLLKKTHQIATAT